MTTPQQPSRAHLDNLSQAQLAVYQTGAQLAQAHADTAAAQCHHNEALTDLNRAIHQVLHGAGTDGARSSLYDLSSPAAQEA
ncbi:hypothetical protein [Streptomyces uncialis]|uniref:hypothetical protein n=1 Tax=Streptomyces uncialis TaxID=1048205 RepID=UPI0022502A78|nr:hypothetical protein [Streptomyces uncialis]MCX4661487.1 hypothetical protein [Streptomyces uncialis]